MSERIVVVMQLVYYTSRNITMAKFVDLSSFSRR